MRANHAFVATAANELRIWVHLEQIRIGFTVFLNQNKIACKKILM
jgi:hypothetical protein